MTALNKFGLIIWLLMGVSIVSYGQNNDGDLEDIEVVIRKDKEIVLPRANRNYQKVTEIPKPEKQESKPITFGAPKIGLSALDPSIRINKLKSEPLDKLYGNYVRGAFGNYANTYFEGFFGNKREDKGFYNLHVAHDAYGSGPVDNSNTNRNQIGLNGGLFYDNYALSANAYYDRQFYNFYGFSSDSLRNISEQSPNAIKTQVFNRFGLGLLLSKRDQLDYLNFDLSMDYDHINDDLLQDENWFNIGFNGNYDLNIGQRIIFDSRYVLGNYNLDTFSNTRHLVEVAPRYQITKGDLTVSGGFKMSVESDTNLSGDVHVYPMANIEYSLLEGKFIPYAGLEGGIMENGLNTFTTINPFLQQGNLLSHSNREINLFGGFKTSLLKNVWLNTRLSYSAIDNLPLMINSASDESKFQILYAGNASVFNLHAGLTALPKSDLRFGVTLDYNSYGFSDTTEAWHLPNFESHFFSEIVLNKKIYMNVDIFFINGIFAYTSMERKKELDPIFDLNYKFEYLFSERFSSFVEFKNILSTNYQRYLYYDSRGIQVRAGLTYTF